MIYERQTYSVLEWVGDVGGLFDGLGMIARMFMGPFSAFAMKAEILSVIFKQSSQAGKSEPTSQSSLHRNLKEIPREKCLAYLMALFCKKRRRYNKMLERAEESITRQLDLVKYLKLQRM